jgi:glycerol-3-phosphate dehydrogenase
MNYAEVTQLLKDDSGRINGVKIKDKIKNSEFKIKGNIVVNATGCFADQIRLMDNP